MRTQNDPNKPARPSFPRPDLIPARVHAHVRGYWVARIAGRQVTIGVWDHSKKSTLPRDPIDIAAYYHRLTASSGLDGLPVATVVRPTIAGITEAWLSERLQQVAAHRLARQTYDNDRRAVAWLLSHVAGTRSIISLKPTDFDAMARDSDAWAFHTKRHMRAAIRALFRWAHEVQGFPKVAMGRRLATPAKSEQREERHRMHRQCWTRAQATALLEAARDHPIQHAVVCLMLNGAMNSRDIASLGPADIDLDRRILVIKRHKTKFAKVVPLWDETLHALRVCGVRKGMRRPWLLTTQTGDPLYRPATATRYGTDNVSKAFRRARRRANQILPADRAVLGGFPTCRRTFKTVTNRSRDADAQKLIMGHTFAGVHSDYSDGFPLARLRAITDLMWAWLSGEIPESQNDMVSLWG